MPKTICFEVPAQGAAVSGYDNSLTCTDETLLNDLMNVLKLGCGIYNDDANDCPEFFAGQQTFSPFPGDNSCTYGFHTTVGPNQCVRDVLNDNLQKSWLDKHSTLFLILFAAVGATLLLGSCGAIMFFGRKRKHARRQEALLVNDDGAGVERVPSYGGV